MPHANLDMKSGIKFSVPILCYAIMDTRGIKKPFAGANGFEVSLNAFYPRQGYGRLGEPQTLTIVSRGCMVENQDLCSTLVCFPALINNLK